MTKEKVLSFVRHLITIVAGLLLSYGIGQESLLTEIGSIVLAGIGFVWSIKDQTYTIGKIEAFVRHALTFVGGFLVNKAILSPEKIELWVGLLSAILPGLLGNLDKNWGNPKPIETK